MLTVGIAATALRFGCLRNWVIGGCLGSAASLCVIAILGGYALSETLLPAVFALGFFNGAFAVAAIGSMMALAGEGREKREGTRMGLWGAAQAIAAGFGGLTGAAAADVMRTMTTDAPAFGAVFVFEAGLFLCAAFMALRIMEGSPAQAELIAGE